MPQRATKFWLFHAVKETQTMLGLARHAVFAVKHANFSLITRRCFCISTPYQLSVTAYGSSIGREKRKILSLERQSGIAGPFDGSPLPVQ